MYFSDRVKLRDAVTAYADGFPVETITTETEVFADRHSVKSSLFYAAQAAGKQLDVAFTVHIPDYAGQTELEYNGALYEVVNTYELDSERVDLNCRRR